MNLVMSFGQGDRAEAFGHVERGTAVDQKQRPAEGDRRAVAEAVGHVVERAGIVDGS